MNELRNLRVSTKLLGAFGIVLALTAMLTVFAVSRLANLQANSQEIATNWLPMIDLLHRMNSSASDLHVAEGRALEATSPAELQTHLDQARDAIAVMTKSIPTYDRTITSEHERQVWTEYTSEWQKYRNLHARVVTLLNEKKTAELHALMTGEARQLFDAVGGKMDAIIQLNIEGAATATARSTAVYGRSRVLMFVVLAVAIVLGGFIALAVSRAISDPLKGVIGIFKSMSAGKLDNAIETSRQDEIGVVLSSLAEMQAHLRKLLAENSAQLDAIGNVQAIIEFDLDGTIKWANPNFISVMGYSLEEIRGQHHRIFVDAQEREGPAYEQFWAKLRRGEVDKGRYLRLGKGGREVWLDAFYSPLPGADGQPIKVVKYASDATSQVLQTRAMERAVVQAQEAIKAATGGDLTARMLSEDKSGDLRTMAESINSLLASMTDIVSKVQAAASEVYRGADEISQGNANLSQRTEQQSSSLEETASSMEEMTSTVKQNADNAGQANQLATAARDQAEKGGVVTAKAVRAMSDINESSRKIADIIGVIDEIAFQTNLLALNAAVEAARAGEQGRGFAVVASEVRSLAGRSATAAKEIKSLIQDSVKKVEDGAVLVTQSGQTLGEIVASVKKVSDIVAEIAAASREQSSGIEQVNKAVMQMDEMTQQNAALVEQATAASHSMADQARSLNEMMSKYRAAGTPASIPTASAVTSISQARARVSGGERRGPGRARLA